MPTRPTEGGKQDNQQVSAKGQFYGNISRYTHINKDKILHRSHDEATTNTQETTGKANDDPGSQQNNNVNYVHSIIFSTSSFTLRKAAAEWLGSMS